MSLADRLPDLEPPRRRGNCLTCSWYEQLNDQDRQAFDKLAARDDIPVAFLLRLSREENDLDVHDSSFRRHMDNHHTQILKRRESR